MTREFTHPGGVRLVVSPESPISLCLQVKHQLSYLIIAGKLEAGTQLPTVRDLGKHLGVNPGTIARAYRDLKAAGLIDGQPGRGTFVRSLVQDASDNIVDLRTRQVLLGTALRGVVGRGISLGFTVHEIHQHLAMVTSEPPGPCRAVFVGPTSQVAAKYAALLEGYFGRRALAVAALTPERLGSAACAHTLTEAYFVVTLTSMHHQVQTALAGHEGTHRIVPLTMRISQPTLQRLAALTAGTRACLISEAGNLHNALNLITNESCLTTDLPVATIDEPQSVLATCAGAELVIHTYSVAEKLDELGVARERRLELSFEVTPDSIFMLSHVLGLKPRGDEEDPVAAPALRP